MNDSINDYMKKMQQIDEMIKKTLSIQQKHIPEKYSNIETTLKLLHNLISTFKKKADNFEDELKARAKIDDLGHQIEYHRERIIECQKLSHNIGVKISNKRVKVRQDQQKVLQLRKEILILKADNVKKILRLEQIEKIEMKKKQAKNMENKKMTWKMKTQYNRSFYHEIDKTNMKSRQLSLLIKEKEDLTSLVNQKLERKIRLNNLINQAFGYMKDKLIEKERKSNSNGMNGSLLFKILQNDKPLCLKPLKDRKNMLYDVLKSKHQNFIRSEKVSKDLTDINLDQFMEFSNLQVIGMVQIAGGYAKVLENIRKSELNLINKELQDTKTNAALSQPFS